MKYIEKGYGVRLMDFLEIKELVAGDKIAIGIYNPKHQKMVYIPAEVITPLFWNSDADEPDWELETSNGFVDVYSIYEIKKQRNRGIYCKYD